MTSSSTSDGAPVSSPLVLIKDDAYQTRHCSQNRYYLRNEYIKRHVKWVSDAVTVLNQYS